MKLLPPLCLLSLWFGADSAQESKPVIVEVYAEAHLPCSLDPKQKVDKFDWKKNGTDVFFYDGYNDGTEGDLFRGRILFSKAELKNGIASINVTNTRLEDSGNYTCKTFGPNGKVIHRRLIVGAAPKPHVMEFRKGIKRLLECEVQGEPKPEVEWTNSAGEVLAKLTNVKEIKERSLKLNLSVTMSDNYTCVAIQRSLSHKSENTLIVNIQNVVVVLEGDKAVLPCFLMSKNCNKSMIFEWRKGTKKVYTNRGEVEQDKQFKGRVTHSENEQMPEDASLIIDNTQLSDNGMYTCNCSVMQQSHVLLTIEGNKSEKSVPEYLLATVALAALLSMKLMAAP